MESRNFDTLLTAVSHMIQSDAAINTTPSISPEPIRATTSPTSLEASIRIHYVNNVRMLDMAQNRSVGRMLSKLELKALQDLFPSIDAEAIAQCFRAVHPH